MVFHERENKLHKCKLINYVCMYVCMYDYHIAEAIKQLTPFKGDGCIRGILYVYVRAHTNTLANVRIGITFKFIGCPTRIKYQFVI